MTVEAIRLYRGMSEFVIWFVVAAVVGFVLGAVTVALRGGKD